MAKVTINFNVTPANGTTEFWIVVDKKDVRLVNGKGSLNVEPGTHGLIWWFTGAPGGLLSIVGKVGDTKVVEVKNDVIPKDPGFGAGIKPFNV